MDKFIDLQYFIIDDNIYYFITLVSIFRQSIELPREALSNLIQGPDIKMSENGDDAKKEASKGPVKEEPCVEGKVEEKMKGVSMEQNSVVQPLLTDLYQITMAYAYWKAGRVGDNAVFDLFFRKSPFHGEFTIFAGLTECLIFLQNFKYSSTDIKLSLIHI